MLPEWADTNQIGNCRILYGGFSPRWAAGKLERAVVDQLATYLSDKYPHQPTAIVIPNWYEYQDVKDWINQKPTTVIACSLTDPLSQVWYSDTRVFGYGDIKFDFWAVACNKFFKNYRHEELLPTQFDYLFLNYNRKPHPHRVDLVQEFECAGIIDLGCTTLSGTDYTVGDIDSSYEDSGARDVVGDIGIPNDIYSLGRLDIWQHAFINIVSETQFDSNSVFLSEKTFKPIIGLRPFIINGNPQIYTWLRDAGFDCFEDIFPVQELIRSTGTEANHKLIVEAVKSFKDTDLMKLYHNLLPRLINNQTHFYEYATSQSDISNNIKSFF
jgi:hypothetical protein